MIRSRPQGTTPVASAALPPARGPWSWTADLGVLALGLALAVSAARLFRGASSIAVLVAVAGAAWLSTTALRRGGMRPVVGEVVHLAAGALLALVVAAGSRESADAARAPWSALAAMVRDDFTSFSTDVAPVAAGTGHLLVMGALIWLLATFASNAAIRLRSPVQAAVPHTVAVIGLGLIARDQGRILATAGLLAALSLYALSQAAWRNAAFRWIPRPRQGVRAPLLPAAAILLGASAAGLLALPGLPGGDAPVVELRTGGIGRGPRNVVSPFVEVGSLLGPRSDDLLFTARRDQAGYWRLTALDEYDPDADIWVLANSYDPVDGDLSDDRDGAPTRTEVQVAALEGFWVPAVEHPQTVESNRELGWDPSAGSLITRNGDLAEGDTMRFTSPAEPPDPTRLADARVPDPADVDPVLLSEDGVPASLRVTAEQVAGGLGPYQAALALQNWFRGEFDYDATVDLSGSQDPLSQFLALRRGFCQQFSSAFALAARTLGLPARVVVGFTSGEPMSDDAGTFSVHGRHAHAWPEVLFDGIGWVAFEPTPGRGDPANQAVTGVAGAQAPVPADSQATTSVVEAPTTTVATSAPTTVAPTGSADRVGGAAEGRGGGRSPAWAALLAAAAAGAVVLAARWWRRRRGHSRRAEDDPQASWEACLRLLQERGMQPGGQETPVEFARRVRRRLGTGAVLDLARVESKRRWSADAPTADDLDSARTAVDHLERFLTEGPSAELEHA